MKIPMENESATVASVDRLDSINSEICYVFYPPLNVSLLQPPHQPSRSKRVPTALFWVKKREILVETLLISKSWPWQRICVFLSFSVLVISREVIPLCTVP